MNHFILKIMTKQKENLIIFTLNTLMILSQKKIIIFLKGKHHKKIIKIFNILRYNHLMKKMQKLQRITFMKIILIK